MTDANRCRYYQLCIPGLVFDTLQKRMASREEMLIAEYEKAHQTEPSYSLVKRKIVVQTSFHGAEQSCEVLVPYDPDLASTVSIKREGGKTTT